MRISEPVISLLAFMIVSPVLEAASVFMILWNYGTVRDVGMCDRLPPKEDGFAILKIPGGQGPGSSKKLLLLLRMTLGSFISPD
jgi:hypothetical protein